jgi:hypothetical protein
MKKLFLILLFGMMLISIVGVASAETTYTFGVFKQGQNVSLIQDCSSCTYNNITSIMSPSSSLLAANKAMTKNGRIFNYTFTNTASLGNYIVTGIGDLDGEPTTWTYNFVISGNGKDEAGGGVIVLFSIFFIILVFITCYLAIYTIGHLMKLDFDLIDLAFDWGVFFAIIAMYFLEQFYLGNPGMEGYLLWFISIGGLMLVLVPIIAFILSITVGTLSKKSFSQQAPSKIMWRRAR